MTYEVAVFVNLFCVLLSTWAAMHVNSKYIRPAKLNALRFQIFELRDRLAILAMSGIVKETSGEYVTLRNLMNVTLRSTKDFKITEFVKLHVEIAENEDLLAQIKAIIAKVENEEMPDPYRKIVVEYFDAQRSIYYRKARVIILPLVALVFVIAPFAHIWSKLQSVTEYLSRQQSKIDKIKLYFEHNTIHSGA